MKEISVIYKGNLFFAKLLRNDDVNLEYVNALKKANFIVNKKNISIKSQIKYIKKIKKNKSRTILGIFYKKKLIATSGFQDLDKKEVFVGIFLFDKKFLKKGFGYFFINLAISFVSTNYKKKKFKCGIKNNNIRSIKSFEKAGFKKTKKSEFNKKNNSRSFILNI